MKQILLFNRKAAWCVAFLFLACNMYGQQEWEPLGPSYPTGPNFQVAIAPDGTQYIAHIYVNKKLSLLKFNGASWESLDPSGLSLADNISFTIASDGTPYIAYTYPNQGILVKRFNGNYWENVGEQILFGTSVLNISLSISPSNTPYIGYVNDYDEDINVEDNQTHYSVNTMIFNGEDWENVGEAKVAHSKNITLIVASDNELYLNYDTYDYLTTVEKFNGAEWEFLCSFYPQHGKFVLGSNSTPYIAYRDYDNKATVVKYNGSIWETVGDARFSAGTIDNIEIAISAEGTPYVGYQDNANSGKATVMKFNGITWVNVGLPGFTPEPIFFRTSLAIAPDNRSAIMGFHSYPGGRIYAYIVDLTEPVPPGPTKLASSFCNTTQNFSTPIYADNVSGAAQYRFRVTDGSNVQLINRPSRYFTINKITGYTYGKTYTVDVAAFVNGQWTAYGTSCNITTPTAPVTQVMAVHCGTTVSFITNIYADGVTLAMGYRFRVTDGANVQYIDKPSRYFTVNEISGYAYNKTYVIDVAARINGQWGDFGNACVISTAIYATSQLDSGYCGTTMPSIRSVVYAKNVSQATGYRFRIMSGGNIYILENTSRYFILNHVPGNGYGKTYAVEVAVQHSGSWGPYGNVCTVSTPDALANRQGNIASDDIFEGGEVTETRQSQTITLIAYPNPYTGVFTIEMETQSEESVTIRAFDMTGKLVEDITVSPSELTSQNLGSRYADGIYNVIVIQGSYQKSFKIVKK